MRHVFVTALVLSVVAIGNAQQAVNIDWSLSPPQPTSPPITVDKSTQVSIVILNANDYLYDYSCVVKGVPREPLPAAAPPLTLGNVPAECKPLSDATDALKKLLDGETLNKNFNPPSGQLPNSVSLAKTKADLAQAQIWSTSIDQAVGSCTQDDVKRQAKEQQLRLTAVAEAVGRANGTYTCSTVVDRNTDYTISIWEKYQGATTNHCTNSDKKIGVSCDISYKPVSTTVTASGGFLFSTIPVRTYERRNVPGSSDAELVVNNAGPVNIALTALVNVKFPWDIPYVCPLNDESYGCAVSIGPAYLLGTGSQQASNFGLFAGFSIHAWRYLYITPGVQVAQWNDFPAGFSYSGQTIPSTFTGNLQPVVRTTAKFGVAVTFKGWDFTKAAKQLGTGQPGKQ